VQNLGKVDFGVNCRDEIVRKLQRRQQNWKLDVNLRNGCKADAANLCADVDHDSDHADVMRCLMKKRDELSEPCLREVRVKGWLGLGLEDLRGAQHHCFSCRPLTLTPCTRNP